MATKKSEPSPIDIEDVSQLSMLAYQIRTRPDDAPWRRYVERLKSERARKIAHVMIYKSANHPGEIIRAASYYQRWADATAKSAKEASRRPSSRKR